MRDGRVVERAVTAETDAAGLARGMVGRDVVLRSSAAGLGLLEEAERTVEQRTSATPDLDATGTAAAPVILRVDQARHTTREGRPLLDGLSLVLARGEILGLEGVEGNGQAALEEMLNSLIALDNGTAEVEGGERKR